MARITPEQAVMNERPTCFQTGFPLPAPSA